MLTTIKRFFSGVNNVEDLALDKVQNYYELNKFIRSLDKFGKQFPFYERSEDKGDKMGSNGVSATFYLSADRSTSISFVYDQNNELIYIFFVYDSPFEEGRELITSIFTAIAANYGVDKEELKKVYSEPDTSYKTPDNIQIEHMKFKPSEYEKGSLREFFERKFENNCHLTMYLRDRQKQTETSNK